MLQLIVVVLVGVAVRCQQPPSLLEALLAQLGAWRPSHSQLPALPLLWPAMAPQPPALPAFAATPPPTFFAAGPALPTATLPFVASPPPPLPAWAGQASIFEPFSPNIPTLKPVLDTSSVASVSATTFSLKEYLTKRGFEPVVMPNIDFMEDEQ